MREQTFFQPTEENKRELQTFGGVQCHERNRRSLVVLVGIRD